MFKFVGIGLMTIAGFIGYSIVFSFAYGLSPADAAKIVITGGLNKDPISIYQKTLAEIDSIKAETFRQFKIVRDSLALEKRKVNTEEHSLEISSSKSPPFNSSLRIFHKIHPKKPGAI